MSRGNEKEKHRLNVLLLLARFVPQCGEAHVRIKSNIQIFSLKVITTHLTNKTRAQPENLLISSRVRCLLFCHYWHHLQC